jgi:hypothetical protein
LTSFDEHGTGSDYLMSPSSLRDCRIRFPACRRSAIAWRV